MTIGSHKKKTKGHSLPLSSNAANSVPPEPGTANVISAPFNSSANKSKLKDHKKKNLTKGSSSSCKPSTAESYQLTDNLSTIGISESGAFPIGSFIIVEYRDKSHRVARVIDHSKLPSQSSNIALLLSQNPGSSSTNTSTVSTWQYYIHYNDFNRRMDEWVDTKRIIGPAPPELCHDPHSLNNPSAASHETNNSCKSGKDEAHSTSMSTASLKHSPSSSSQINTKSQVTTVSELEHDEHEGMDANSLIEHEEITKVKNFKTVLFGKHIIECWYFSPFPEEYYGTGVVECLYFCEFTFRFFRTKNELIRYQSAPNLPRHPPGNEIYRDENVSMFEIDGAVEKIYCQNLCYFAKLFLDHKTLYWDVDPFLFYVLCTYDNRGFHPVGFFSKEKYSDAGYNLACILTFPSSQRKGYGRFLISFSYELSKKEEKIGSPEKPLSDLGAVSYKSYWASTLLSILANFPGSSISVLELTRFTSILVEDVIATLHMLGLLVPDPSDKEDSSVAIEVETCDSADHTAQAVTTSTATSRATTPTLAGTVVNSSSKKPGNYILICPPDVIAEALKKYPSGSLQVDPSRLHWAPLYVTDPKKDKWSLKSYTGVVTVAN